MDAGPEPSKSSTPSAFDDAALVPRKSLVDDARFDITAMVDLVFMMNIYFLVTWTVAAIAEIDLPTARHCTAAAGDRSVIVTVVKGPLVYIGDVSKDHELSPGEVDQKVVSAVEEGIKDGKEIILIKAEKDVPLKDVAHLASVATGTKGCTMKLMLAVTEKNK